MLKKALSFLCLASLLTVSTVSPLQADTIDDLFKTLEENADTTEENPVQFRTDIYCAVDGKAISIKGCVVKDNRVYVPIKPVFEAMGFQVTYVPSLQQVGLLKGNTKILLDLNKGLIIGVLAVGDKSVDINASLNDSVILDSATYIPIRNITENMYCKVNWDKASSTVFINSPSLDDVQVTSVESDTVSAYVGDNSTTADRELISILLNIKNAVSFTDKLSAIDMTKVSSENSVEVETARIFANFSSKMLELNSKTEKPQYNADLSWDSPEYKGYDTYRAATAELKRLAERLTFEKKINGDCKDMIIDIANDIETMAFAI